MVWACLVLSILSVNFYLRRCLSSSFFSYVAHLKRYTEDLVKHCCSISFRCDAGIRVTVDTFWFEIGLFPYSAVLFSVVRVSTYSVVLLARESISELKHHIWVTLDYSSGSQIMSVREAYPCLYSDDFILTSDAQWCCWCS